MAKYTPLVKYASLTTSGGRLNLNCGELLAFYNPPEVSSMKYCCLGVLRNTSGLSLNSANGQKKHLNIGVVGVVG